MAGKGEVKLAKFIEELEEMVKAGKVVLAGQGEGIDLEDMGMDFQGYCEAWVESAREDIGE